MEESSGPFIKDGTDTYEENSLLYYFIEISLWIYGLGFIAYLVLILNTYIEHTYNKVPGMPGSLYSLRYTSLQWVALMVSVTKLFVPFAMQNIILYRRTLGCGVLWSLILFLGVLADLGSFLFLAIQYGSCNQDNQANNLCNSLVYCCVPSIFSNPYNGCANGLACPVTVTFPNPPTSISDLHPNNDFLWLFWTHLAFIVFDLVWLLIIVVQWVGDGGDWSAKVQDAFYKQTVLPTTSTRRKVNKQI